MEDGNIYYVDVDTREIEKLLQEIVTQNSELAAVQSEQASEAVSIASDTAEYISSIKQHTEIEVILLFAVIAFCGFISGLLIANLIRK